MARHVTRFLPDNGPSPEPTPQLEPGDRLTRPEFERRYDAMPDLKKAELIEGVVHMPSPVRAEQHGDRHADLIGWLTAYRANTPGVRVSADAIIFESSSAIAPAFACS